MNHLFAKGHLFLILENLELVSNIPQIDANSGKGVSKVTNSGTFPSNVPLLLDRVSRSAVMKVQNNSPNHGEAVEKYNPG